MIRERFQRAALVGLASMPGFFGCARADQAQVQAAPEQRQAQMEPTKIPRAESQPTAVARQSIEALVNQDIQGFVQTLFPGNPVNIGQQEMLAMRQCQGIPTDYIEGISQDVEAEKSVLVIFSQQCINTGRATVNAVEVTLENRGGKWGPTGFRFRTVAPQEASHLQQPQREPQRIQEPQRSEGPGSDWIKMDVPNLGISLSAPPKWTPETKNTSSTTGIVFYDKEHNSGYSGLYSAVVAITKQQRTIVMSDEDVLRQQLTALRNDKDSTDIQTGTITFGGEKAQLVSWLYLKGAGVGTPFLSLPIAERNKPVYVMGVNLAKGNVIWQATLVGDNAIRPSIESTFRKMLASLKFS